MTVAVTKTKAEQALTEQFRGGRRDAAGRRARCAEARKAAIGAFAALGLPHRRIEEWKYTDLRNAMKEALPPAARRRDASRPAAISMRRWSRARRRSTPIASCSWTALIAPELSGVGAARVGYTVGSLAAALAKGRAWLRSAAERRPDRRRRHRAQHRLHDATARWCASPTAPGSTSRCCWCSPRAGSAAAARHHAQHRRGRRRRRGHAHRGLRRAAGAAAARPDQHA